jgi:hypothetical protein
MRWELQNFYGCADASGLSVSYHTVQGPGGSLRTQLLGGE